MLNTSNFYDKNASQRGSRVPRRATPYRRGSLASTFRYSHPKLNLLHGGIPTEFFILSIRIGEIRADPKKFRMAAAKTLRKHSSFAVISILHPPNNRAPTLLPSGATSIMHSAFNSHSPSPYPGFSILLHTLPHTHLSRRIDAQKHAKKTTTLSLAKGDGFYDLNLPDGFITEQVPGRRR